MNITSGVLLRVHMLVKIKVNLNERLTGMILLLVPPKDTVLDMLGQAGFEVIGVGKTNDIFFR